MDGPVVRRGDLQHGFRARASRAIGADQLHGTLKLTCGYFRKQGSNLSRGTIFYRVARDSAPARNPFFTEATTAIVDDECFVQLSRELIFVLHVLVTFSDTICFMSHPRVKIIFLLLILCANSLRADQVIREAQTKLAALGYYKASVDGSPGSMTSAAIRRYQLAKKLKVTGSLNQQTLDALGINAPQPAPDYSKINALFDGGPLSGRDSTAQVEAVRHAQRVLAESGFYAGPHNGLPSATLTASINEWQLAQGLPQTGKLDSRTLAGLGIVRN